jgi:hypothetical protein
MLGAFLRYNYHSCLKIWASFQQQNNQYHRFLRSGAFDTENTIPIGLPNSHIDGHILIVLGISQLLLQALIGKLPFLCASHPAEAGSADDKIRLRLIRHVVVGS